MDSPDSRQLQKASSGMGTFAGVFTPSILTILGIILFRRVGYVVGTAGLLEALGILGLATLISVLTSLSLSAIATNLKVKKGGDYYLISRTLGVEFGGAIGLVLFLAQAVSIAFYCIGFGEAVSGICGWEHPRAVQSVAAAAAVVLFVLAWLGADVATKFQFVVMAVLAGAILSFFWGSGSQWSASTFAQSWFTGDERATFWIAFAIFFPAVTGFTQGVSMSGDLRDPARSLPRGTFAAVGLAALVYLAALVVFAGTLPLSELAGDYDAMRRVAGLPWLVDAGVIAATLSSAMASFLGAPRILQSLAGDKVFRVLTPFAKGAGPRENPRRGVLLGGAICMLTIGIGNLNVIAPVVSMFFLISYGLLNYATYFEARAGSPSFRPRFRWFDQRLSLAGSLLCLGAMAAINVAAAAVSAAVLFGMYQYLKRTAGPARWADSKRAHYFRRAREDLLAIAGEPEHPRDWRPHILAFSDDQPRREKLLRFASWIEGGTGLTTAVRILIGEGAVVRKQRGEVEQELRREIKESGFHAFALCLASPDMLPATRMLVQSYGVGPLRANVILLNWLEQVWGWDREEKERRYGAYLRAALRLGRNIVVLEAEDDDWDRLLKTPPGERCIVVWWSNDPTSRLLLLMAYLMTRTADWEDAKIRVLAAADPAEDDEESREDLLAMLKEVRIDAQVDVVPLVVAEDLIKASASATIVFVPMRLKDDQPMDPFGGGIEDLVSRLPVTALAIAGEEIDLAAEPDEGPAAETAAAQDVVEHKIARAEKAEKEAQKALEKAKEAEDRLREQNTSVDAEADVSQMRKEAEKCRGEAEAAARRAAKARASADSAQGQSENDRPTVD